MSSDSTPRSSERQSDLAVMDANEYKQKRRLERILDAMDKIEDQANLAWERFVNGEISHDAKNIMIQLAVKEAIREAYKLLIDHQRDLQEEHDVEDLMAADGGMRWKAMSDYWLARRSQPIGKIPQMNSEDIVIWGLRDFLETEEMYYEHWTVREKPRNRPSKVVEREHETSVPERVSWAAALRLKEFLDDEHDLEIQFETLPGGEAKFDYSDLLDAPTEGFDEQ